MYTNRFLIVLGVLSLLLVAMAFSSPFSDTPKSVERGRTADATRWTAMGEYYGKFDQPQLQLQHSRVADAARWTAMAEHYQGVEEVQNLQRARAADAARWTAMTDYYVQLFGK